MNDLLIIFSASVLLWLMFLGLFVLYRSDGKIRREIVIHAVLAFVITWVVSQMIKEFFPTMRPFELNGEPILTLTKTFGASFPSSHSAAAFSIAVTIWLHHKKIGFLYMLLALFVSWGRIAGNVHFPIDVLGGAILGSFIAIGVDTWHPL